MIRQAKYDPEKYRQIIQDTSFLAEKIRCEYITNKDVTPENFYYINDCALMLMGENLSLCGSPTEDDMESILSFCQFLGIYGIETELADLPVKTRNTMYLMEYSGGECSLCDNIVTNENIYGFSQFCCTNFTGAAFSTVYSYFARKVNRFISDIYYLTEDRKIVSGAVATRYGSNDIYITFVSTDKAHRGKGMASEIIRHIIASNPGRRVILMCEDRLVPFYEKLGFVHTDDVYLYLLREENI